MMTAKKAQVAQTSGHEGAKATFPSLGIRSHRRLSRSVTNTQHLTPSKDVLEILDKLEFCCDLNLPHVEITGDDSNTQTATDLQQQSINNQATHAHKTSTRFLTELIRTTPCPTTSHPRQWMPLFWSTSHVCGSDFGLDHRAGH